MTLSTPDGRLQIDWARAERVHPEALRFSDDGAARIFACRFHDAFDHGSHRLARFLADRLPHVVDRSSRAIVIRELTLCLATGRLLALRREPTYGRGGGWARDTPAQPKAPSRAPTAPNASWFEVEVVDEVGVPIPGARVSLRTDSKSTGTLVTDGNGQAHVDVEWRESGASCSVDPFSLIEPLRSRWDQPRQREWLARGPDRSIHLLHGSDSIQAAMLAERRHTFVLRPWCTRARLLGLYFDINKAFLLPVAKAALHSLKDLLCDEHELLIVGHTDASGDPSYNDPLSRERAASVEALLRDDVASWLEWYGTGVPDEKRWGVHEDRMMMVSRPDLPEATSAYGSVVHWYQATRGLTVDGYVGPVTREHLVREYMAALRPTRSALSIPTRVVGAGESYALSASSTDVDPQARRRVELFFFDRRLGVQPPPPPSTLGPKDTSYETWLRRARETRDFEEPNHAERLVLELPDDLDEGMSGDVALVLATGSKTIAIKWGDAERDHDHRRFVFLGVRRDAVTTLKAARGAHEVVLWESQKLDELEDDGFPMWLTAVDALSKNLGGKE